jgi:hypothetical protein
VGINWTIGSDIIFVPFPNACRPPSRYSDHNLLTVLKMADVVWRLNESGKAVGPGPKPDEPNSDTFRPDILDWIDKTIQDLSEELRALSLDIHGK